MFSETWYGLKIWDVHIDFSVVENKCYFTLFYCFVRNLAIQSAIVFVYDILQDKNI